MQDKCVHEQVNTHMHTNCRHQLQNQSHSHVTRWMNSQVTLDKIRTPSTSGWRTVGHRRGYLPKLRNLSHREHPSYSISTAFTTSTCKHMHAHVDIIDHITISTGMENSHRGWEGYLHQCFPNPFTNNSFSIKTMKKSLPPLYNMYMYELSNSNNDQGMHTFSDYIWEQRCVCRILM